jgi:beta-ureidopropionase / N-carbamoyl-L-amino-acid hydrolase
VFTRRDFLSSAARVPLVVAAGFPLLRSVQSPSGGGPSPIPIDAARLRQHIEGLSAFGRPPGGSFAEGVTRVAYSQADVGGRQYVLGLMREALLSPRIDAAGNILGLRAGTDAGLPAILFGSHIDSVPDGGNFDGVLGTMAALEVMQALDAAGVRTRHPLAMAVWQNEEGVAFNGGLCGSRAAAGELPAAELDQVWNGMRMADAIRRIGGDPENIPSARRPAGSTHCYLELHIEQGGTLDRAGIPIGIVEGIVGIDRYEATVRGVANHAGTTAMVDRHDALVAASQLVLAVNELVRGEPGRQVGTVGQLNVTPNAPNVVPGRVTLTIELRDLSSEKVGRLHHAIEARAAAIARATGTEIALAPKSHHEPAIAHPLVMSAITDAAARLGVKTMRLPSGAGHDAQMAARFSPMGMIFVPSIGGISHSPKEATSWEDCARGTAVLLHAVLAADRISMA